MKMSPANTKKGMKTRLTHFFADCFWVLVSVILLAVMLDQANAALNPADFVERIDHPYYPLTPGTTYHFEGTLDRINVRAVTHELKIVQGVVCTVVRDRAISEGALSEESINWFAQDKHGNVWLFGEDSRHFDTQGDLTDTKGSWEAGRNLAEAGLMMPASPTVGQTYHQESAPGVADDLATVLAVNAGVVTPFGTFTNCILTRESSELTPDKVEQRYYAPGIGLVLTIQVEGGDERSELGTITRDPVAPADFVAGISHPYLPMIPGTTFRYLGSKDGRSLLEEIIVTHESKMILGVSCTVVRDRMSVEGLLEEENVDWFAQDKEGNVWYFGEITQQFDPNGLVLPTGGSWEAGKFGAEPGIIMPSRAKLKQTYLQERAPGVALDMATVVGIGVEARLKIGVFKDCLVTRDFSLLHLGEVEERYYAPGVGLILSVVLEGGIGRLELASVEPTPPPHLQIIPTVDKASVSLLLSGIPGRAYVVESSSDLIAWDSLFTNTLSGNQTTFFLTNSLKDARQFFRSTSR